ncbi:MAG: BrnT family toxin [Burkholderiaceae bacterium]|nr:BrnT family toxin [Burkholderiaceae bacterium]
MKRITNMSRHGIDFKDCARIFDSPMLTEDDYRLPYGETRLKSLGLLDGRVVIGLDGTR